MLTQIYEVSTIEEAAAISAIGVDHIGVLVGDGRFSRLTRRVKMKDPAHVLLLAHAPDCADKAPHRNTGTSDLCGL